MWAPTTEEQTDLGLVSLQGELVVDGGGRLAGATVLLDGNGVTLRGPGPGVVRLLPWRSVEHLRFDHPATLADGRPAVGLRFGTTGRELCVLVGCDQLPPARARALAASLAALVASDRAQRRTSAPARSGSAA